MLDVSIYIEGQRLDLFKDESVNIKSSVKDINDISKIYTDFSKSFSVPASKGNNSIFKHYYNADITGGYDARTSIIFFTIILLFSVVLQYMTCIQV